MLEGFFDRKILSRTSSVVLFILIWGTVYYDFFTETLRFPVALKLLDEILLFILFIFVVIKNRFKIKKTYLDTAKYLIIFLIISFFSMLWNNIELSRYVYAIRFAAIPLLISFIVYNFEFSTENLKKFIRYCLYIIIGHSIIVLLHGIFVIIKDKYHHDSVYGIIGPGASNLLGYLISIVIIYFIYKLFFDTYNKILINSIITLFLMSNLIVLEAKGAIISVVSATFIMLIVEFKRIKFKKIFIFVAIFLLIFLVIFLLLNMLWSIWNIRNIFNPINKMLDETRTEQFGDAARGASIVYAVDNIRSGALFFLFGYGPGVYESPAGYLFGGPHIDARNEFFSRPDGSIVSVTQTQIANLLYEYGIFGFIFFELFLFFSFIRLLKYERGPISSKSGCNSYHGWVKYLISIVFLGQFTINIFDFQYVIYPFWIILFSTFKIYNLMLEKRYTQSSISEMAGYG